VAIYTKRNALVGYFVLRGLGRYWKRAQHRRRVRALKISALVAMVLASVGAIAVVARRAMRRQRAQPDVAQGEVAPPGPAEDEEAAAPSGNSSVSPEPAPAA
jgi:hypothetical protein